jgi:hypothetical protein
MSFLHLFFYFYSVTLSFFFFLQLSFMILFNLLSNAFTLVMRLCQRFCILMTGSEILHLNLGELRLSFLYFFKLYFFLNFHLSIFYLLEIELHFFSFQFFFCIFISNLTIHLLQVFFIVSPSSILTCLFLRFKSVFEKSWNFFIFFLASN